MVNWISGKGWAPLVPQVTRNTHHMALTTHILERSPRTDHLVVAWEILSS